MRIDLKTNKPGPETPGSDPYVDGGSLWMLDPPSQNLLRLDPRTHVGVKSFPISFSDVTMGGLVGTGYGSVWAGDQQTVWRVDEAINTITVIPLPGVRPPTPSQGFADSAEMAFANGKAWYGSPSGLYEIDAQTNNVTLLPIRIGNFANLGDIAVVSALGSIWIRTSGTSIARIDPTTGTVIARYPASGGGGWFTISNGSIWVANADDNTVWRLPIH
jgi:streptogramin lyase